MMTLNLFEDTAQRQPRREDLCPGAAVLRGFAVRYEDAIFSALGRITNSAPFRHMIGGFPHVRGNNKLRRNINVPWPADLAATPGASTGYNAQACFARPLKTR